jgi:hypothetical protein
MSSVIIGPRHKQTEIGGGKFRLEVGGDARHYRNSQGIWMPMDFSQAEGSAPSGFTHFYKRAQWCLAIDTAATRFRVYPDRTDLGKYVEVADPTAQPCAVDANSDRVEITRNIPAWSCVFKATFSDMGFRKEFIFQNLQDMPDTITMNLRVVGLDRDGRKIKDGNDVVFRLPNPTWYEESLSGVGGDVGEDIVGEVVTLNVPKGAMGGASFPVVVDPTLDLGGAGATGVEDCMVKNTAQSANYGASTILNVYGRSSDLRRILYRLDISSIPAGVSVDASTLSIYMTENRAGGNAWEKDVVNTPYRDWVEGTSNGGVNTDECTFRYRNFNTVEWDQEGGIYAQWAANDTTTFYSTGAGTSDLIEIDVKAHTERDLVIDDGNLELCMKAQDESSVDRRSEPGVISSENATTGERPSLSVVYSLARGSGVVSPTRHAQSVAKGATPLSSSLSEGLVGLWRMEEALWDGTADEVVDSSGSGNHGTAVNGVTTVAAGLVGRCGDFVRATSDYVTIADDATLKPAALTVAGWVKYDALNVNMTAVGKWVSANGPSFVIGHRTTNQNEMEAIFYNGAAADAVITSDPILNTTDWFHFVVTHTGSSATIWLNAVKYETDSSTTLTWGAQALLIGAAVSGSNHFDGKIDEIGYWSRVLDDLEITELYNAGLGLAVR